MCAVVMTAADVLYVLDLLAGAGIGVWLDGGWGVDALLGEQTRPHNDLDLAMRYEDAPRYIEVMAAAGFRMVAGGTPFNFVMVDDTGGEVDVHVVDLTTVGVNDAGVELYGPNGLPYEVGCLEGEGIVLGRPVACCTAEFQLWSHTGYEPDAADVHDVMALHKRFGLPLPPAYGPHALRLS